LIPSPQLSARSYRRDPTGALEELHGRSPHASVAYLGRQRLVYLADAELVEEAFIRHADGLDDKGRVARWWIRRPEPAEDDPLRRALERALSEQRARVDAAAAGKAMQAVIADYAQREEFDLHSFSVALFVAGFVAATLDARLTPTELDRWTEDGPPDVHRTAQLVRERVNARGRCALAESPAEYLADPVGRPLASAFHDAGAGTDAARLLALIASAREMAKHMTPAWLALDDPALEAMLRSESSAATRPLHAGVVLEALRLNGSHTLGRFARRPFALDGIRVAAHDYVFTSPYALQRDERWWPDPLRFDPGRWQPSAAAARPSLSFIPFGLDEARTCPARHLAVVMMETALQLIVGGWKLHAAAGSVPIRARLTALGPRP
jgi:cytochrome P450